MGIFSKKKKKKKEEETQTQAPLQPSEAESLSSDDSHVLLAMPLFAGNEAPEGNALVNHLNQQWGFDIEVDPESDTLFFTIDEYIITVSHMPAPVPGDEVEIAARYNYMWDEAVEVSETHQSHALVTVMGAGKDVVKENMLLSKVLCSILSVTDAIGVYFGARSLMIQKDTYIDQVNLMTDTELPLFIWIYFGMRQENNKQSMYTYGLTGFGKMEMEIVDSDHQFDDLMPMLYNMVHYVLQSDVTLHHGETIGISAEQKLDITWSEGRYVEGETIKIAF